MNWQNLKDGYCPRPDCGGKVKAEGMIDTVMVCNEQNCGFSISEAKFNQIVGSTFKKQAREFDPDANLSALNNL